MANPNDKKPSKQKINDLGSELGVDLSKAMIAAINRGIAGTNFRELNKALIRGIGTVDVARALDTSKVSSAIKKALQPSTIDVVKFLDLSGVSQALNQALQPQTIKVQQEIEQSTTNKIQQEVELSIPKLPEKVQLVDLLDLSGVSEAISRAIQPSPIAVLDLLDLGGVSEAIDKAIQPRQIPAVGFLDLTGVDEVVKKSIQPSPIIVRDLLDLSGVAEAVSGGIQPSPLVLRDLLDLGGVSEAIDKAIQPSSIVIYDLLNLVGVGEAINKAIQLQSIVVQDLLDPAGANEVVSKAIQPSPILIRDLLDVIGVREAIDKAIQPSSIAIRDLLDLTGVDESVKSHFQPQEVVVRGLLDLTGFNDTISKAMQVQPIAIRDLLDLTGVSETIGKAIQIQPIVVRDWLDLTGFNEAITKGLQLQPIAVRNLLDLSGVGDDVVKSVQTQDTKVPLEATQPAQQKSVGMGDLAQGIESAVVDQQLLAQQEYLSMHSDIKATWDQINLKAKQYGELLGYSSQQQADSIMNLIQIHDLSVKIGKGLESQDVAAKVSKMTQAEQLAIYSSVIKLQQQEWNIAQDLSDAFQQQLLAQMHIKEGLTDSFAAHGAELTLLRHKGLVTDEQYSSALQQLKQQQKVHLLQQEALDRDSKSLEQAQARLDLNRQLVSAADQYNQQIEKLNFKQLKVKDTLLQFGQDSEAVQKDLLAMVGAESQGTADLLLKRVMVGSNLRDQYAQTLTTFMLENKINSLQDARVRKLVEQLNHRQHVNDHLKNEIELQESLASWQLELIEELEGYSKGWEKLKSKILAVVSDPKILKSFLTVKGLETLNEGFKETKEIFGEFRSEGLTFAQSLSETQVTLGSMFSLSGASMKETAQIQGGLLKEMGNMDEITRDVVVSTGKLSKTLGVSAHLAGQLQGQLMDIPGATAESATESLKFAGALAKAAHVAPGAVLEEIAHNAEATATYTKAGGTNITTAAVAAKKLGMEFTGIVKMADGLLDFENSINKQLEASVLLGREVNLDKARELALNGDLVAATQEMLRNVGGEAEFNKMNVIQRRALADSMGVSVQDLGKMVKNQDKLNNLTEEQAAALADNSMTLDEILGNAQGFSSRMWDGVMATGAALINIRGIGTGLKAGLDTAKDMWAGFKAGTDILGKVKGGLAGALGAPTANPLSRVDPTQAIPTPSKALDTSAAAADKTAKLGKAAEQGPKAKSGQGVKDFLTNLSSGLKSMAGSDVLFGALNMIPASLGLVAMLPGILGAKALELLKAEKLQQALQGLASGLESMAKGKVALGALVLIPASLGFVAMTAGAVGLAAVALLGIPAGAGLAGLASGLSALGAGAVLKGVLATTLLGVSLIPAAYAFSLLAEVDTSKIVAFSIAIPLLGLAAAGLGALKPLIVAGSIALAALGGAVLVIAGGMFVLKQAEGGFNTLQSFLQSVAANASAIPLVGLLGGSLAVLGLSALIASPGILLLNLMLPALASSMLMLGAASTMMQGELTSIVSDLSQMVDLVPGLYAVGGGLASIAAGLGAIAVAGLAALPALVGLNTLPSLVSVGTTAEANTADKSSQQDNNKVVESKLDVLIEEVKTLIQVASKGGVVNMDGKKVGEVIRLGLNSSGMR